MEYNRQSTANAMFDFIAQSAMSKTRDDILSSLERAAAHFGMERFAISGIPLPGERLAPYFLLNAWPQEWFDRYLDQDYVHADPVIYRTKTRDDAFVWSEALAGQDLSRGARRVMNEATEFGMRDGYSVPLHSVGGFQAIVTFGAAKVDLSPEDRGALHIISIYAHNRLRALLTEPWDGRQAKAARVTPREREVILWCAAGKTNWEIGQILRISEKTVQHEIAAVSRKLNVVNRAQLIAESFRIGIIR